MTSALNLPSMAQRMESAKSVVASRTEAVTFVLRDMITRGDFPSGMHLQELPLAELMGVSRTPIREALNALAKEGLLEPGPRRGYKVRTFAIEEIVSAYEMRATLEGMGCRLLAERGLSESLIREARDLLDLGDQLLDRGRFTAAEHESWSKMNNGLHSLLIGATENKLLIEFVEQTCRVPLTSASDIHWYRPDEENLLAARQAHRDHHEIVNAIVRRQSTRASARMQEHIYMSMELVRSRFRRQTVGFDAAVFSRPVRQEVTR